MSSDTVADQSGDDGCVWSTATRHHVQGPVTTGPSRRPHVAGVCVVLSLRSSKIHIFIVQRTARGEGRERGGEREREREEGFHSLL